MTTIKLKNGSGAPTAGDLAQGEPALDLTNKRLYTEDSGGTVIEVGTNPTSVTTGDITATGTATFAGLTTTADVSFGDNDKAIFGAGSDLQIYHDGSNSYVSDAGTGSLFLTSDGAGVVIEKSTGENLLFADNSTGRINLYHNNSVKLATTATGIDVTGTVVADGLTVDGNATISNATNPKLEISDTTLPNTLLLQSLNGDSIVGTSSNTSLALKTNNLSRIGLANNGDISFYEDTGTTAKLFWDASAESLGIGTSSPSNQLSVASNTNATIGFDWTGDNTAKASINTNFSTGEVRYFAFTNYFPTFYSNNTEAMRIDSSGNLLVGTTTHRNFSGGTTEITVGTSTTGATAGGAVTFGSGSGFLGYVAFQESEGTLGTLTSVPLLLKTGNTERMRIDSSGNVGIGTSSPQAYLHVYGNNAETLRLQGNDEYTYLSFRGTVGTEQTFGYLGFANDTGTAADLNLTNSQAGAISFSANGAERMRIDSNGNVGIGTSSPDTRLDLGSVAASTQTAILARNSTGDADFKLVAATDSGTASNTSFFEMGIAYETGVYQPNAMLKFFRGGGSTGGFLAFTTNDDTERMRLDGSGNLLVGKTSTAFGTQGIVLNANGVIDVTKDGDAALFLNRLTSDGAIAIFHKAGTDVGSIDVTASATSYNTSSDQRLKDNIVDAPSASDDIDAIQVRSFDWRVDGSHQKYGMVAQELQSVAPEAVTGDADSDDMMGVDYSKLVPMMMKEIQSLRARVAQLEGEN